MCTPSAALAGVALDATNMTTMPAVVRAILFTCFRSGDDLAEYIPASGEKV
jgi:hypothetical protein